MLFDADRSGPGAGPIGVKEHLEPFLPVPRVLKGAKGFQLESKAFPKSIGRVRSFYGNFGILLRGLAYLRSFGAEGLPEIARHAVLNANYMLALLKNRFEAPYGDRCMHEFVLSLSKQKRDKGVSALDFAKRLADYGYHAPTVYFPLIVPEAVMVEPTETESVESLKAFCETLLTIDDEATKDPELLHKAPTQTVVGRLDEVGAARKPVLKWSAAAS
jgi:glycine dehydrogenase subunit 2